MSLRTILILGSLAIACGPPSNPDNVDAGDDTPCADGETRCSGSTYMSCQNGEFVAQSECPEQCSDSLGCVTCVPGTGTCNGDYSEACRADGSGYDQVFCDPLQGSGCNVDTGLCDGACAPQNIGRNYIGCEYFPTVTGNDVDNLFEFAVAISNTTNVAAQIHIEGGALAVPVTLSVPPGSVAVQALPWEPTLKACNSSGALECGPVQEPSSMVTDGAYHLRSTQPVTVYQFNPLNYELNNNCACDFFGCHDCSFTNDASLLLPTNALTPNYVVATYPVWNAFPSILTITATADNTQVTIVSEAPSEAGNGLPALSPGSPQTITMNAGDAAQFLASSGDFTGSLVSADKPVQVIGAHYCTQVPNGITACDHIEESMFPIETLADRYLVTAPAVPSIPNGKIEVIRVIATENDTSLIFDPPQAAPANIAFAGDFVELVNNNESFEIRSDKKILVAQYMEGQDAGGDTGDPAMALATPVEQYRTDYQFHAPVNYEVNYVNITAPTGANIQLDGSPVGNFTPIGATGMGVARMQVSNAGTGDHIITGDEPFGIMVYGYGQYTSFFYPGGLNLGEIVIE